LIEGVYFDMRGGNELGIGKVEEGLREDKNFKAKVRKFEGPITLEWKRKIRN
jgi:hypothetical protein